MQYYDYAIRESCICGSVMEVSSGNSDYVQKQINTWRKFHVCDKRHLDMTVKVPTPINGRRKEEAVAAGQKELPF